VNYYYRIRLGKHSAIILIILLCGAGVGYAVYRCLPTWMFVLFVLANVLFVLANLMGYTVVRGASRHADRDEQE